MINVEITHVGSIIWKKNNVPHNNNGPASILFKGTKLWYVNGKRHRLDGPAYQSTHITPAEEFWIDHKRIYTEFEYWLLVNSL